MDNPTVIIAFGVLIAFIVAFVFIVFVLYRQKRETIIRQREVELRQEVAEVELKALRAQINPHFIFNSMNSIYKFMQQNDMQHAGEYLVKFSNLIRLILENSMHRAVSLEEDLKTMALYIQMEQLRMNQKFNYSIEVDKQIDAENTLVPPMIIQPFVENSIWHGLNNKPTQGNLSIKINKHDNLLCYLIEDDGVQNGESNIAEALKTNKKLSLGMTLTQERLDLMNKMKKNKAAFEITDILDQQNNYKGKRVELKISFETAL